MLALPLIQKHEDEAAHKDEKLREACAENEMTRTYTCGSIDLFQVK